MYLLFLPDRNGPFDFEEKKQPFVYIKKSLINLLVIVHGANPPRLRNTHKISTIELMKIINCRWEKYIIL